MKKSVFGIAALLLAMASCNKVETENQPIDKTDGIPFSATISLGDNAATKALAESGGTITATWAKDEKIALIHNGVSDEMTVSSVSGGSATITGTITGTPADGDPVTIIYPSSAADGTTGNIKSDLLYAQNGLLIGTGSISENYDARKGNGTLKVDGTATLSSSVSLTNQIAIFKFTVKNADASATIDVKPLTITIGTQDYVITPASATSTLYVALPAVSSQTVSFSATGSDSKTYTCSKDGVTFTAGKYYQSTLKMAISVSSITINNAPAEALFVNSKGTLTATVLPDNATDKTVTWSSSDPDYVSINATTGEYEVKGTKGYGSATITATAGGKTATCTITGKVTYTSLKAGDVIRTGDTFFVGKVYFKTTPAVSFVESSGVITLVESNGYYKFKRGSNGTMPNVTSYKVASNTDGIYIVSGSGTSTGDKFTIAVHTK